VLADIPFHSAQLLIQRAQENVIVFSKIHDEFFNCDSIEVCREHSERTREYIYTAKFPVHFPEILSAIAFDVINELRSALDHAIYDAAVEAGGCPDPTDTKFPFGKTMEQAKRQLDLKNLAQVPDGIRKLAMEFEPYEGGRYRLYELNQIRNQKIHRILSVFDNTPTGISVRGDLSLRRAHLKWMETWDSSKRVLTFLTVNDDASIVGQLNFRFAARFQRDDGPAIAALYGYLANVTKIVDSIKMASNQIGKTREDLNFLRGSISKD
jgi:hypothetical protein